MSSVQDYRDCPRCGEKGHYIFYSPSGEDWFLCSHCGYMAETVAVFHENKDSKNPPDLFSDPNYVLQETITEGFGAYYIEAKDGFSQFGAITDKPVDDATILSFKKALENPNLDPTRSYLSRWDEENKKIVYLVGLPKQDEHGDG